MKSDMAGIQMCREGSKIWNRANPGPGLESIKMGIYINFDAEKEVWYYTEDRKGEQEAFSWRRSGYLRPNWYINRTHRHVCRIEDLETVNLYTSPFCAKKAHLIVIGLPCVRVEIFRTGTNPIVEGYGGVHLEGQQKVRRQKGMGTSRKRLAKSPSFPPSISELRTSTRRLSYGSGTRGSARKKGLMGKILLLGATRQKQIRWGHSYTLGAFILLNYMGGHTVGLLWTGQTWKYPRKSLLASQIGTI